MTIYIDDRYLYTLAGCLGGIILILGICFIAYRSQLRTRG